MIAITRTIAPAKAMITESMIGFGNAVPTKLARGSKRGMLAAQIIPMPKMIPT